MSRAALWDMDGTLVDSGALHFDAWRATMRGLGRDFTRADFDATFGQRNDAILRRLVDPQISDAEIARIGDDKEATYRELVRLQGIEALPGVRDWLARLAAAGWRQAIASSGPRANAQAILAALDLTAAFAAIVSAEDVVRGKPEPDVFLAAAERLGARPVDCVVVEDAPSGIEAGRRAGMRTIGVLTTHPHLDADRIVRSLADLEPDAFDALLK